MNSDSLPFYYNEKLLVNFVSDQSRLDNIVLKVEYRMDNPDSIKGFFKYGKENIKKFYEFVNQHNKFKIESISEGNMIYYSDDVIISNFNVPNGEDYLKGTIKMYNFYSKFIFEREKSEYKHFDLCDRTLKQIEDKRFLEFQLLGPAKIWERAFIHEIMKTNLSFIDEINQKNKFEIDNFQCSYFVKDILFKTNYGNEFCEVSKKRVFFRIEEIVDRNVDDDNFVKKILIFFEKLLLLISFASSSNIDWLIYNFISIIFRKQRINQIIQLNRLADFIFIGLYRLLIMEVRYGHYIFN